jgi:holliday junction DNA helicase RuvA
MIGKIKGVITDISSQTGLIETQSGVGYWVILPKNLIGLMLPSDVELYTYHHVREDAQILFGFADMSQYKMFQLLLTVDGVGPKTAHTIISYKNRDEIVRAVREQDVSAFTAISGLGKKTTQKIILELSSKLKTEFDLSQVIDKPVDSEAIDALVALGYKKADAHKMLHKIDTTLSLQEKIRKALSR